MKYRREIDGLRTVAVLPVILFHAGLDIFSGGYVGVDVFFVISGFLITSILIAELQEGRFSIGRFYERRARRILPALFVVIAACVPFAWAWMLPSEFKDFSRSILATLAFSSNILFWFEADYFDTAAELKPLLHTWSLAVEEQYYLFFPPLLYLLWRLGRSRVLWAILGLAVLSFALMLLSWGPLNADPSTIFYQAHTRVWELLAGSLCACLSVGRPQRSNGWLSGLGLALIVGPILLYDHHTLFPSWSALPPVLGTALIILYAAPGTPVARLLSTAPFVGIGLISYSAYLWHQPLFAFARIRSLEEPSLALMIALAVLSLGLAWISWRFIEAPFRKPGQMSVQKLTVILGPVAAALACVAVWGAVFDDGQRQRLVAAQYDPDNAKLQRISWRPLRQLTGDPRYSIANNAADETLWFDLADPRPKLLVLGNSHAKDLFNVLMESETATATFDIARMGLQVADMTPDRLTLPNLAEADVIMIVARYFSDALTRLDPFIAQAAAAGQRVVLVQQSHEFQEYRGKSQTLADVVVQQNLNRGLRDPVPMVVASDRAHWDDFTTRQRKFQKHRSREWILDLAARHDNVVVLERMDYACDAATERCFSLNADLEKFYYDYAHNTLAGARAFGARVDEVGWLDPVLHAMENTLSHAKD